jgi:hypothetical protein
MDAKRREEIINIIIEGMPHNNSAWGRNRKSNIRWLNEAIDLTEKATAEEILKMMESSVFVTDGLKNELKKKFGVE